MVSTGLLVAGAVGAYLLLKPKTTTTTITLAASTTSLPATGGTVAFTGTSSLASGTVLYIFQNGQLVGTTVVGSGGAITFTSNIGADTTSNTITYIFYVSDNQQGT